jgi:hypothetical protein
VFGKIFVSLWDGTLATDWPAWSVFVFMIASATDDGVLDLTPQAIAARTGIPLDQVRGAIEVLEAEDSESRTSDHGGRRIIRLDEHRSWGWQIVNYTKYREIRDREDRKRQYRESKARTRASAPSAARQQGVMTRVDASGRVWTSVYSPPLSTQEEVEVEAVESKEESKDLSDRSDLFPDSSVSQPPPPKRARTARSLVGVAETPRFVEFYEKIWPRRVKRHFANVAWHSALRKNPTWTEDQICDRAADWANYYADKSTEIGYVPHPSSWLAAGGFLDPPPAVNGVVI